MTRNNTPQSIKKEIANIVLRLTKVGLAIDQNYAEIKSMGNFVEVIYGTQKNISVAIKKNSDYDKIYKETLDGRNFSILLKDGGIIQISYRFKKNKIESHRLVYLPNPFDLDDNIIDQREDESMEGIDDLNSYVISNNSKRILTPIRFDYKNEGTDLSHPLSHLHFGNLPTCRIPLVSPITPEMFMDFILRNFYFDDFVKEFELDNTRFSQYFSDSITSKEKKILHIDIKT